MSVVKPRAIRWTRDEYYRIAASGVFEDRRVELIRGEVIEMTPQDGRHATGVALADRMLQRVFSDGFVVRSQLPLSVGVDSDPEPDIAVVEGDPRDHVEAHPRSAVLVVEVSSSSLEHDRTTKTRLYSEAGIADYWIVNLIDRRLEVFREPTGTGYADRRILRADEAIAPLARAEISVSVADLLP